MNAAWIPVGSAVVMILLGLGVLEVTSKQVRVEEPSPAAWQAGEAPTPSGLTQDDLVTLGLAAERTGSAAGAHR